MKWYLSVFKKYVEFSGRARRKEYWMFVLFNMIFMFLAMIIDNVIGTSFDGGVYGVVYLIYAIAVILPSFAVSIRRLHDVGKSGWFILISLIPIVGAIWLLVLMCTEGVSEENAYGINPKAVSN